MTEDVAIEIVDMVKYAMINLSVIGSFEKLRKAISKSLQFQPGESPTFVNAAEFDINRFIELICIVHRSCDEQYRSHKGQQPGYDEVFERLLPCASTMAHVLRYGTAQSAPDDNLIIEDQ